MCTVVAVVGIVPEYPVIVGANRDEDPTRQGTLPRLVDRNPRIWAALEPREGGTWLGLNEHGLLAVLTNRSMPVPDTKRRSRGLLCLDALREESACAAVDRVRVECDTRRYNHFNLLCADRREALVLHYDGTLRSRHIEGGVHLLCHGDLDDESSARAHRALALAKEPPLPSTLADWVKRLERICADEDPFVEPGQRILVRQGRYITLSSSILALHASDIRKCFYAFCQGAPGVGRYRDFSALFAASSGDGTG